MNDPIVVEHLTDIIVALDDISLECRIPLLVSNLPFDDHETLVGHLQTIRDAQSALCAHLLNHDD